MVPVAQLTVWAVRSLGDGASASVLARASVNSLLLASIAAVVAVGAIWFFTLVNIAGSRETGVTQVITTVFKFVPLAIIGIVGLFYIDGGNFTPFAPAHGGFDWHINAAATLESTPPDSPRITSSSPTCSRMRATASSM